MPKTAAQFSVNDIGDPEPVTATTYCRRITIGEDPSASGWPREWTIHAPGIADGPVTKSAGSSHSFIAGRNAIHFRPGKIVGYIETKSGTGATMFNQYEDSGEN